jgi:hypothetical protein
MPYKVQVAATARREAESYHRFILEQSHDALPANNWWNGFLDALDTLRSFPTRCSRIPEQKHFRVTLYQLRYASHRIIFRMEGETVRVLRLYPFAARPLQSLQQHPEHGKKL